MRIVRKERIDVKKFMEDMKANRTKRALTSLEERDTRAEQLSQGRELKPYDNCSNHSMPYRPTYRNDGYY